jgi:hypothetical protein
MNAAGYPANANPAVTKVGPIAQLTIADAYRVGEPVAGDLASVRTLVQ